jgi:hypothetical protein
MRQRRSAAVQRGKVDGVVGEMASAVQRSSARCCSKMEERGVGVRSRSAHVEEGEDRGSGRGWRMIGRPLWPARQRRALMATDDVEQGKRGGGGGWHVGQPVGGAQLQREGQR